MDTTGKTLTRGVIVQNTATHPKRWAHLLSEEVQTMPTKSESRAEAVIDLAEDAVRASIEAAEKVTRASLDASTEAARTVQKSLRNAREALAPAGRSTTTRKST